MSCNRYRPIKTGPEMTYGNAYDDAINSARPAQQRDPFIPAGSHQVIVASIEPFNDERWGASVRGTFEIESSQTAPAGGYYVKLWNLKKPPKYPATQESDADNFVDFVCKLNGVRLGEHQRHCQALLRSERDGGQLEVQPARGMRIIANGRESGKVNDRGTRFVTVSWVPKMSSAAEIGEARRALDQRRPFYANGSQATGPAAPAPSQYAPQPPVQQYTAQVQPQYVQQPAPPSAPPQWQGAPVAPPQGGGFSQFVQQPAAQAPGKPPWNPAWGPIPPGY